MRAPRARTRPGQDPHEGQRGQAHEDVPAADVYGVARDAEHDAVDAAAAAEEGEQDPHPAAQDDDAACHHATPSFLPAVTTTAVTTTGAGAGVGVGAVTFVVSDIPVIQELAQPGARKRFWV